MKSLLGVALLLLFRLESHPSQIQSQQRVTTLIEGTVVTETGDPLKDAQVTITRIGTPANSLRTGSTPPALTDGRGRFLFTELDPGRYQITAERAGYVRQEYTAREVTPSADQGVRDVIFRMIRTGSVKGRITDASGNPLVGLSVELLKHNYLANGTRILLPIASVKTNEFGEYRLFWISPGRYYLRAGATAVTTSDLASVGASAVSISQMVVNRGFTATFYPGMVDPSRAVPIEIESGIERSAVDFPLAAADSLYRISGWLIDGRTGKAPDAVNLSIVSRYQPGNPPILATGALLPVYDAKDGKFEVRDIPPGAYWVRATSKDLKVAIQSAVNIAASDVDLHQINLSPTVSIKGRIKVENQPLIESTSPQPQVVLRPTMDSTTSGRFVATSADGGFSLEGIFPGEYWVTGLFRQPNLYLKESRLDGIDVLNQPLVITNQPPGFLDVTVSAKAGQLRGTVLRDNQPKPDVQVVLIPGRRDRPETYKNAFADANGQFTFRGIVPGDYKIFAWETLEPFSFFDPEVVKRFEQYGRAVHISEGDNLEIGVEVIRSAVR